jgi:hypothetical protein
MTLKEFLEFTRNDFLRDTSVPYKHSDAMLVRYANEGLARLAARAHILVDDDRELDLEADESLYELDADIKHVYGVRLPGITDPLQVSTENWTPNDGIKTQPSRYVMDRATQSIRFYPIPDGDYTAIMRVARLPKKLDLADKDAEIELKAEYELVLSDWVAFRAFGSPDADGYAPGESDKAKVRFYEGLSAIKRDEYRQRFGNTMRAHGARVK